MKVAALRDARRWFAPTVLGLVVAGGAAWGCVSRPWASGDVRAAGLPSSTVEITGDDAVPALAALSLVVLTGGLAVLATRGWLRRAVGVLVVLVAAVGLVLVARTGAEVDQAFTTEVAESPSFTGSNAPSPQTSVVWPLLTGVALALAAALGVLTVLRGHRWGGLGGRYEAPAAAAAAAPEVPQADADDPIDVWHALDEGRDPTA